VSERGEAVFSRDSPVLSYWLTRCDGFEVRKGRRGLGEVQEVASHDPLGRAQVLRVRSFSRQKLLPADRIAAVVPARRLLIVEREPSAFHLRAAGRTALGQGRRLVRAGSRTGAATAPYVTSLGRSCANGAHRSVRLSRLGLRHGSSWVERERRRATPIVIAAAQRGVALSARLLAMASRAAADAGVQLRRGASWLERETRRVTPVVVAALGRAVAEAARLTAAASRGAADAARAIGSELRQQSRR
jgi:hypothetical protein